MKNPSHGPPTRPCGRQTECGPLLHFAALRACDQPKALNRTLSSSVLSSFVIDLPGLKPLLTLLLHLPLHPSSTICTFCPLHCPCAPPLNLPRHAQAAEAKLVDVESHWARQEARYVSLVEEAGRAREAAEREQGELRQQMADVARDLQVG